MTGTHSSKVIYHVYTSTHRYQSAVSTQKLKCLVSPIQRNDLYPQFINGSRVPFMGWLSSLCYGQPTCQITKMWKVMQNEENGMI